jgi:hypothetical protein
MSYAAEMERKTNIPTFIEKVRLLLGLAMLFSGLYFGFYSEGVGEGLGFLSFMAAPFVMLTDR